MSTAPESPVLPRTANLRLAGAGVLAAIGAAVGAVVVAQIGKALGAAHVRQLMPGALVFLTVLGVAVATVVWSQVVRRAADPARLLARLVPAVLVLSLVPDLLLGATGTAWGSVVTLMIAHLTVFAVAVPVLTVAADPRRR